MYGEFGFDIAAISEHEQLRVSGASFIAFAGPSFWWLNYYAAFARQLRSEYKVVLETDQVLVLDLRASLGHSENYP